MEGLRLCDRASRGFLDASRITLGQLVEEFPFTLAYPSGDRAVAAGVAEELRSLGVSHVVKYGYHAIRGFSVLGKGKSSVVLPCLVGAEPVALKVRRMDSAAKDMNGEAGLHLLANAVGVGPRLVASSANVLAMELIFGPGMYEFLREATGQALASAVRSALAKARALDIVGIDHGELNDPSDHVLIRCNSVPEEAEVLDFGSSSRSRRASNVTQLAGALFIGGYLSPKVLRELHVDREVALNALKAYKSNQTAEGYEDLLAALNLEDG